MINRERLLPFPTELIPHGAGADSTQEIIAGQILGAAATQIREAAQMSIGDVAERVHASKEEIQDFERGRFLGAPSLARFFEIAHACGVSFKIEKTTPSLKELSFDIFHR